MREDLLGLDLALSVATGTACLGRYAVPRPGPVLVYLAEDALSVVRQRVEGMARHRGLQLAGVNLHVITVPALRLDRESHRQRLLETARRLRPRLLLLDPLVRLHGIDENSATEVAGLLAYFRALQRQLDRSVILVHHTRKNAAGGVAAGQGLRGSSDLHAFGDSSIQLIPDRKPPPARRVPFTAQDGGVLGGPAEVMWIPIPDASLWPVARPFCRRECQPVYALGRYPLGGGMAADCQPKDQGRQKHARRT